MAPDYIRPQSFEGICSSFEERLQYIESTTDNLSIMATLKTIGSICQVSESTVSLAINHPEKISASLRNKIYEVIKKTNYTQNGKKTKTVGLLVPRFVEMMHNEFYGDVLNGIFCQLKKMDHSLRLLDNLDKDYGDLMDLQGILFLGKNKAEDYETATHHQLRAINCGHPHPYGRHIPSIYIERNKTVRQLAEYVVNNGHQNIAIVLGDSPSDMTQREFVQSIKSVNSNFTNDNVFVADYEHLQTVDIVWNKILASKPPYTAIMCVNDLIAYYIYELAERDRIKIPEEISITGFDGITFPRFVLPPHPSLTTAKGNRMLLGSQAVKILLDDPEADNKEHILIPSEIMIGKSVKRIR